MGSRHSTAGAAAVVMAVALALAACSSAPKPPAPPSTTSGPASATETPASSVAAAPTDEPSTAAAKAAVLTAYNGYWRAKVAMLADPTANLDTSTPGWNDLRQFATDTAVADVFATVHTFSSNGIVVTGTPTLDPKVSGVTSGSASIVDCVDSTNWQPVYSASQKSAAAPGQSPRLITNSELAYYDNRWVVTESAVDREKPC